MGLTRAECVLYSEWYGWHFPELAKIVNENFQYARLVRLIGNKAELTEEKLPEIEAIVLDEAKARQVYDAAKTSMGTWVCMWVGG
jgi:nucleolar protein 56